MEPNQDQHVDHVFSFTPAKPCHYNDCAEALFDSEQGHRYFSLFDQVEQFLQPGFERNEIFVCTNKHNAFIGFIWSTPYGAFNCFPFLQTVAVKAAYRSIGAGTFLLRQFEEAFPWAPMFFLIAHAENQRAIRFYERLGYHAVGKVPEMYIPNTTELIMVKTRTASNEMPTLSLHKPFHHFSLKGLF